MFIFATASILALGFTQPSIQWIPDTLSPGVKRPGREAEHSPPSVTEVENAWSYTSTPAYIIMAWSLIKGYVFMALHNLTRDKVTSTY
jgi:hypothetical protein